MRRLHLFAGLAGVVVLALLFAQILPALFNGGSFANWVGVGVVVLLLTFGLFVVNEITIRNRRGS